jgi:hypothetical protein
MPAAVVVGAAVVGAAATVYASNKSSSATRNASNAAIQAQNTALEQQKELSAPYRALGESAIPTLQSLLGIGPGGPGAAEKTLQNMPGYQFAKSQGIDATKASAASMGLALSGNTLEGIDKFSTGLADQTYQSEVQNLMGIAGLGQAAAAGQAANVGNAATNKANIAIEQGANEAGISANTAASLAGIAGNAAGQYQLGQFMNKLNPGSTPSTGNTAEFTVGDPSAPTLGAGAALG